MAATYHQWGVHSCGGNSPLFDFCRASWANDQGPYPVRSQSHPRGFAWNSERRQQKADLGNLMADFSFEALKRQACHSPGIFVKEQPEDLGKTKGEQRVPGHQPASMWQFPQFQQLLQVPGVRTVVFPQTAFGTASVKPTRFLMKLAGPLHESMVEGRPQFDHLGYYTGPLPKQSGQPLIGFVQGRFKTSAAAAWPPALCKWVAQAIFDACLQHSGSAGELKGRKRKAEEQEEEVQKKQKTLVEDEGSDPMDPRCRGGEGRPRVCSWKGMEVPFHDGGGLPSPGRWPIGKRRYPMEDSWKRYRQLILEVATRYAGSLTDLERECLKMTKGGEAFSLVKNEAFLEELREAASVAFDLQESELGVPRDQPFRLPLMRRLLQEAGDCDFEFLKDAEKGFTVGVLEQMPRTPGVFERQTEWALDEFERDEWSFEKANYPSAEEHEGHLREHLEKEVEEGLVEKMAEEDFVGRYGANRAVAALAVLVEDETSGKKRVIHDGTHEIGVNNRIRCQDKIRMPGPREKRKLLEEFKVDGRVVVSLVGDFEKAHRRFLYKEEERGFLGCRVSSKDRFVYVNKVGTFGVGSTPYWWARLSGSLVRLVHLTLGPEYTLEMLLYADDLEVMALGRQGRIGAVLAFSLMASWGAPFKWKKQRGGFITEWVGLTTDYVSFSMGLSEKRANWVIQWIDDVVGRKEVAPREFAAALGRLSFASLALPWERPFLGPLFAWSAAVRVQKGKMVIPWAVLFILKWIRRRLAEGMRLEEVRPELSTGRTLRFWTDASATEKDAWIGGWKDAGEGAGKSEWFSLQVTEEMAPWMMSRGRNPKRMIAALELLATIVAMKIWSGDEQEDIQIHMEAYTDNQGNSFLLKKGMSTKYPITLMLMEIAEMLRRKNSLARLNWVRRDGNQEADDLTNQVYDKFDPKMRRYLPGDRIPWIIFEDLDKDSKDLYDEIAELKEHKKRASSKGATGGGKPKKAKVFGRWTS